MKKYSILFLFLLCACQFLSAQSIAEKKAHLTTNGSDLDPESDRLLGQVNEEAAHLHKQITTMYERVARLYENQADADEYRFLLDQVNANKERLLQLEQQWQETACKANCQETYGLWHAPETTLEQLIIDYGSQDYVYLIPPEVGSIKLSIASNLPIPRACWNGMLEHILAQNGIGIQVLNPYLRQLFLIKRSNTSLKLITNDPCDLEYVSGDARVSFVLSPEPAEVRRAYGFLEKFFNPNTTVLQMLGRDILIIGQAADIQDLLRLYDFVASNRGDKEYRVIPVHKLDASEMARILAAMFDQSAGSEPLIPPPMSGDMPSPPHMPTTPVEANGLKVVVLENNVQALFVSGTKEEVKKAEEIIQHVESQIGGAREKTVFWYTVKHSETEELADVLYRIYSLMATTCQTNDAPVNLNAPNDVVVVQPTNVNSNQSSNPPGPAPFYQEGGGFVVNPAPAQPGVFVQPNPNRNRDNFIVDLKTGAIVMVVENDLLPKIKDLIRKLDVPKKMVQIEVLLFEKILVRENNFGLNLLKIGNDICRNETGFLFNAVCPVKGDFIATNMGLGEFFISRKKTDHLPGFDLAYRFLLSQDDIQINACPSILTINQTPATIAINEDISINTGAVPIGGVSGPGVFVQDTFVRAQYGTTISIKPTIHASEDEECEGEEYVTIESDITFDTIQPGCNKERPDVTRRHITNQAHVVDGETVMLGTFRRKVSSDTKDAIPFIGELPGIGKLFSENAMKDNSTEMFIFITPHVIHDPKEQLNALRRDMLCRRPGDLPYFLECLREAEEFEKNRLMAGSLNILLGRPANRYYMPDELYGEGWECGEYDGR